MSKCNEDCVMIKCGEDCTPCCDYCIYVEHDYWIDNGEEFIGKPIGCMKFKDEEHQKITKSDGCCDDFRCIMAIEVPIFNGEEFIKRKQK